MQRPAMIPILLLSLWAMSSQASPRARSTLGEQIELNGVTETHTYDLNVPNGADGAELTARARIKAGEIRWTLIDAEGTQRLSGHGKRGRITLETGYIENPTSGNWKLEIELLRAKGYYRVDWESE